MKNLWHAISRVTLDPGDDDTDGDDGDGSAETSPEDNGHGDGGSDFQPVNRSVHTSIKKNAWDHEDTYSGTHFEDYDHLLFGATQADVQLSTLHPEQVQIFRLWQIYLENIDPLLKVTHTPTLQARIVNAVSNLEGISPSLEALIFSIYCVSVLSLTNQQCRSLFKSPRRDLQASYHFACQQSLLNCKVLRSGSVESLTALYLYLVSVRSQTDPRSLSSTLATAIRVAQRMGLHDESTYSGCNALDAEMRRRLWWSLVNFDHRLCEMTDFKTTNLTPTWDCKVPHNINDFELRPESKNPPTTHDNPTEALFAVVRSELADFIRHSAFHMNFISPSLNVIAKQRHSPAPDGDELTLLEETIEDKYLNSCDPDNPLHFMTIWTTRAYIARNRLPEHYSRLSTSPTPQTDAQRSAAVSHALRMLECETKLRTSPLVKGFLWHVDCNVPALAYVHILNVLMKRPGDGHADRAWEALSDNYEARAAYAKAGEYGISDVFSRVVLQVWAAREELCRGQGRPPVQPPRIVEMMRDVAAGTGSAAAPQKQVHPGRPDVGAMGISSGGSSLPIPVSLGGDQGPGHQFFPGPGLGPYPEVLGQPMMDVDMNQFLNPMDCRWMHSRGW
ncbi:hypothetical protein SLS63_008944 [Diaporthe eres]|uniref:Xylanolytic transcriptional activator regulatory domain-containing protein n=1 Tax=Diaporthe eres TaxID=83184 RepID=A0ABR1P1M6_DIAER